MKQYIYTFKNNNFDEKIDVRNISSSDFHWCLKLIQISNETPIYKKHHNCKTARKLLTDHFPELLI